MINLTNMSQILSGAAAAVALTKETPNIKIPKLGIVVNSFIQFLHLEDLIKDHTFSLETRSFFRICTMGALFLEWQSKTIQSALLQSNVKVLKKYDEFERKVQIGLKTAFAIHALTCIYLKRNTSLYIGFLALLTLHELTQTKYFPKEYKPIYQLTTDIISTTSKLLHPDNNILRLYGFYELSLLGKDYNLF